MTISVYLPLLLSVLLSALSRPLAHRLSPRTVTPALVTATVLVAAASTWGLVLLAATLLQQAPEVTEHAVGLISFHDPVPVWVGAAAAAVLAVGGYRLVELQRRRRWIHRVMRGLCDDNAAEELVVVAAAEPHAVAVPARFRGRGHIVVTSGMLTALDADGRAVLLAHERAHLQGRHSWQRAMVGAAAALNPLLRTARDTVALLLERCADETAAETVGSRTIAARSLARAALATASVGRGETLAFHRLAVTTRVAALHHAPAPRRRMIAGAVVLLGVATTVAAADATGAFLRLVERLLPGTL